MKTRIAYVERLTDSLKGYKGVIFEDHPNRVYIENPPSTYATTVIDGETYAAFPKFCDKYADLHDPRPNINVGDKVTLNGDSDGTVRIVEQVTLGLNIKTEWWVRLDGETCRYTIDEITKVEPEPVAEPPKNVTVTIKAYDLAELELLARSLSEAISDVEDKERELRNAKETLSKFMEEIQK